MTDSFCSPPWLTAGEPAWRKSSRGCKDRLTLPVTSGESLPSLQSDRPPFPNFLGLSHQQYCTHANLGCRAGAMLGPNSVKGWRRRWAEGKLPPSPAVMPSCLGRQGNSVWPGQSPSARSWSRRLAHSACSGRSRTIPASAARVPGHEALPRPHGVLPHRKFAPRLLAAYGAEKGHGSPRVPPRPRIDTRLKHLYSMGSDRPAPGRQVTD